MMEEFYSVLNRLTDEVRANERLRVENEKMGSELWDLRNSTRPELSANQLQDIAALLLVDNGLLLSKKIQWIKEVRALTSCSLKAAKDAVEAANQQANIDRLRDKLAGDNEPPF